MSPFIHSLHIYPIKSCQGIKLDSAELTATGFKYDRNWMLVDKQGQFLSQRQHPDMALIKTTLTKDSMVITAGNNLSLEIPLQNQNRKQTNVKIWDDVCTASIVSTQASQWFSDLLEIDCDLVFLADSEHRLVDPDYASEQQRVGFADGFPLLVVSLASSDILSEKLDEKVSINRFRANIVIGGCAAHAEDSWSKINVNGIEILLAKPCSRCVIPSINQHSAEKHQSLLKTLASYRRNNGKVYFGQNGLHQSNGVITVDQAVLVTEI